MKVVIIGGNAAGMSAGSRLVRKSKDTEVIVYEKSSTVSYGACGLPYYIAGLNDDSNKLKIRSVEQFEAQGIKVCLNCEVKEVDREQKHVVIENSETGDLFYDTYDQLIIASGSSAIRPPIEGIDLQGVYTLKTIDDAIRIKEDLTGKDVRKVAVIGGGYIGLELCEAAFLQGKTDIKLFEALPEILNGFDLEISTKVRETLQEHQIDVHLSCKVNAFLGENGRLNRISTDDGVFDADIALIAVGVRPNTLFINCVDKLPNGAIITNSAMQTSAASIYAAGDCSSQVCELSGMSVFAPLGTNANRQGRFVADKILGNEAEYKVLQTAMLRTIGCEAAKTGLTQEQASKAGYNAGAITIDTTTHPEYFAYSYPIRIKVCYDLDTKVLLGAQIFGKKESAWRIGIFACAIQNRMKSNELGKLDLGYAPPFTEVWDPVQIAANVAK